MSSPVIQIWALDSLNVNGMLGFVLFLFLFVTPLANLDQWGKMAQNETLVFSITEVFSEVKHMKNL